MEGILRRWLSGELGAKSFQQMEEEFAEIVIPKVWLRMGRNISRVAQQLNVSPKKVRRALRNARMSGVERKLPRYSKGDGPDGLGSFRQVIVYSRPPDGAEFAGQKQ
jgi:hypothetical protein